MPSKVLDQKVETASGYLSICTMHLAKGLEFRAVVASYAVQISVNRDNYNLSFGGGEDHLAGFRQFDVKIRWDKPQLRLIGFYAESDTGGFIIYLHVNWPWPIPLGNSGLALVGIGFTYGERFAPKLSEIITADPLEEMRKATAEDYVAWARKPQPEQWIPVNSDVRVFGLDTDIGDLSSAGKVLRFQQAGISYVSYGPVILLGGSLYIFDTIKLGDGLVDTG